MAAAEAVAGLWLHQEPFLRGLKALGFTGRPLVSGEALPPGALLVWEDDNQVIQHACYALGDGLVLNKQAQSWWAPRQVLSAQTVLGSWQELRPFLYTQGHA